MITIDYKSRLPIYEQLVARIRTLALNGALSPGEQLPSVRQLSGQLGINPNTVQRAYASLLHEGIVEAVTGKGNFISRDALVLGEARRADLLHSLAHAAAALSAAGVSEEQAVEQVRAAYHPGTAAAPAEEVSQ